MQPDRELYDVASLRALEQRTALTLGDDFVLMQRAGEAAWRDLLGWWPAAQRLVVVCGPGNNGGDGYLLAAHAMRSGRSVHVLRLGVPRSALAQRAEAECRDGCAIDDFTGTVPTGDVLVDALFGIGLTRSPESDAARLIDAMNAFHGDILSIDVPSGVDAGTGHVPGTAVRATRTLQMLAAHRGLATGAALDHVGERSLATLDVDRDHVSPAAEACRAVDLSRWLRPRPRNSHKGLYGHVLCVGGDRGSGGAIALCAEAALRTGAGLVSVATRAEHIAPLLARRPELMPHAIEDSADFDAIVGRATVLALGPGLGKGDWGRELLARAFSTDLPMVIDADALNLLAQQPRALRADTVLTPHPGEAARLLGSDTHAVQADRFAAAAELVERFGCIVVLKGAGTIVAAPVAVPRVIEAGNAGMASGGMGDVLTGVIAALRAQGLSPFDAASAGALLHAAAGDLAASDVGERGLLAGDLLAMLHRLANPGARA
jgi:NAD(P)H-hydrate epimerase